MRSTVSLKIGLMGYYGYNAYSDDLIAKAITYAYDKKADVEWSIIPLHTIPKTNLDLIILGGGSLLGHPFTALANRLRNDNTPFIILGTGFREAIDMNSLKYLFNRADLIAVRGHTSEHKLRKHGLHVEDIDAVGDSIFLLPPQRKRDGDYVGAVIRPHIVDQRWMESSLQRLGELRNQETRTFCFSQVQGDLGAWSSLEDTYRGIYESSFWFGNRLHPFCVALINGVPALAVELEFDKVQDVCSTIKYPYMKGGQDVMKLYPIVNAMNVQERISGIREDLNKLVEESLTLC